MRCDQVQDRLMASDSVLSDVLLAEVKEHLASCPQCAEVARKLAAVERAVKDRPTPAGVDAAKAAFLRGLDRGTLRPRTERPAWQRWGVRLAMAAAVVLAVSVPAVLLLNSRETQAADVVDNIVDWNLELAETDSPIQRAELFQARAPAFQDQVQRGVVPADDRAVAQALLDQGAQLAKNDDPVAAAERYTQIQDLLVKQMDQAATRGDGTQAARLGNRFARINERGLGTALARGRTFVQAKPDLTPRMERLVNQHAELRAKLDALLQRVPDATRQQIRRALELGARRPVHPLRKNGARPSTAPDGPAI